MIPPCSRAWRAAVKHLRRATNSYGLFEDRQRQDRGPAQRWPNQPPTATGAGGLDRGWTRAPRLNTRQKSCLATQSILQRSTVPSARFAEEPSCEPLVSGRRCLRGMRFPAAKRNLLGSIKASWSQHRWRPGAFGDWGPCNPVTSRRGRWSVRPANIQLRVRRASGCNRKINATVLQRWRFTTCSRASDSEGLC
jgi:hypothetical protein